MLCGCMRLSRQTSRQDAPQTPEEVVASAPAQTVEASDTDTQSAFISEINALLAQAEGLDLSKRATTERVLANIAALKNKKEFDDIDVAIKQRILAEKTRLNAALHGLLAAQYTESLQKAVTTAHLLNWKRQFFAETIIAKDASLQTAYLEKVQQFIEKNLPRAEQFMRENKGGACFLTARELVDLLDVPIKLPTKLKETKDNSSQLMQTARRQVETQSLPRTFKLGELTSAMPGIGMVYGKDLQNELAAIFKTLGLDKFVSIVPQESAGDIRQWSYTTYSGLVAEFNGDASSISESQRKITYVREPRTKLNPDYVQNANASAPLKQRVQYLYQQDEITQAIHIKITEKQAHIRISSLILRGPGCPDKTIELNEFYTKQFVTESSDVQKDISVKTQIHYDKSETLPATQPPALKNDRIWSSGEILDWGRRDSLSTLAMAIAYHVGEYPLYLEQQAKAAEKAGKSDDALELRGQIAILCESLPKEMPALPHVDGKLGREIADKLAEQHAQTVRVGCF